MVFSSLCILILLLFTDVYHILIGCFTAFFFSLSFPCWFLLDVSVLHFSCLMYSWHILLSFDSGAMSECMCSKLSSDWLNRVKWMIVNNGKWKEEIVCNDYQEYIVLFFTVEEHRKEKCLSSAQDRSCVYLFQWRDKHRTCILCYREEIRKRTWFLCRVGQHFFFFLAALRIPLQRSKPAVPC